MSQPSTTPTTAVPGLEPEAQAEITAVFQQRLNSLIDLQLTLKHIHWNVVGPNFIAVHEMLDEHVEGVRTMSDTAAERIATLGGEPRGTPGYVASERTWSDYGVGRAGTSRHLAALDLAYSGVIEDHRRALDVVAPLDDVSHGILLDQIEQLEMFQWFVRAHLEDSDGRVVHDGALSEKAAVDRAGALDPTA